MSDVVIPVLVGLGGAWVLLVAGLWWVGRRQGRRAPLRDALALLPDVLRLLRGLLGDRTLPRSVRWRVGALLAYLASPIDLIPDVVPVVGWADDVVVTVLVLRSVVRRAGEEALVRHWTGDPAGLELLRRLAGLVGPRD